MEGDASRAQSVDDSDDVLVVRAQAGDRSAFDMLVRRHIGRVTVVARALLQNRADADDLVQESFMRAYNRLSSLDVSRGGFGRWMTRIVTNTGLNARKARRVRAAEPVHLVPNLVSRETRPDQAAEDGEIRQRFRLALSDLSARQRVIVTLYEIDGVPTADIAEQLGMKPETVRWHLYKAREILRRTLSPLREVGDAHDDP